MVSDHRPERGSPAQAVPAGTAQRVKSNEIEAARRAAPPRPVWLLPRPEPLHEHQSRPWLDGQPLQLLSGPERIESGWWDGAEARRDYFIARTGEASLAWIYRERGAEPGGHWFLHGFFA